MENFAESILDKMNTNLEFADKIWKAYREFSEPKKARIAGSDIDYLKAIGWAAGETDVQARAKEWTVAAHSKNHPVHSKSSCSESADSD